MAEEQSTIVRQRLNHDGYKCLFDNRTSRQLRLALTRTSRIQTALTRLENELIDESEFFWKEPGRSNLLTFLYWCKGDAAESRAVFQNGETLKMFPANVAALTMKLRLLDRQTSALASSEIDAVVQILTDIDNENPTSLEILRCEGEVAYALHYLGEPFFGDAIEAFQTMLRKAETASLPASEELDDVICSWRFHLAQTYGMMMKAPPSRLIEVDHTITGLYEKVRGELSEIRKTRNSFYKTKALIEMMVAYRTRVKQVADEMPPDVFPFENINDLKGLLQAAIKEGKDDQYVLARCGLGLRQNAKNEKEFREAISVLQRCPNSHNACYQTGVAYVRLGLLLRNSNRSEGRVCLQEAKNFFAEAIRLSSMNTPCTYLTDIAICLTNLVQFEKADDYFDRAEDTLLTGGVDDGDASNLYKNWYILKQRRGASYEAIAIRMNREALRLATVFGFWSARILSELHKMIKKQMIDGRQETSKLKHEYEILSETLNQFEDEDQPLVTAAEMSNNLLNKMRRLVEELTSGVRTSNKSGLAATPASMADALTAFLYLTVLHKAGKLNMASEREGGLAVEVAMHLASKQKPIHLQIDNEYVDDEILMNFPMRDVFRWILGYKANSSRSITPERPADDILGCQCNLEDKFDVCVMTLSSAFQPDANSESIANKVVLTLKNYFGLRVEVLADVVSEDGGAADVNEGRGEIISWEIEDAISKSSLVVVVVVQDDIYCQSADDVSARRSLWFRCVTSVLDKMYVASSVDVCLVTSGEPCNEFDLLTDKYAEWTKIELPEDDDVFSPVGFARLLLTKMADSVVSRNGH